MNEKEVSIETCTFCGSDKITYVGGVIGYTKWKACDNCARSGVQQDDLTVARLRIEELSKTVCR